MADKSDRVERLLAQLLIHSFKDAALGEKAAALSASGFEPSEIAELVGATPGTVRQSLYEWRKSGSKAKAKRKKR